MNVTKLEGLIHIALKAALSAGREILEIYAKSDFGIEYKADKSPLTIADKKAHDAIIQELKDTNIPICSEESTSIPFTERRNWDTFWLVDPLDGTKEFINRNDEFTVNIALIYNQKSISGVVYAPVLGKVYFAYSGKAYCFDKIDLKMEDENQISKIQQESVSLPRILIENEYNVVASRSHFSIENQTFIEHLKKDKPELVLKYVGSSLKFCLLAEGAADIYPKFGPTMEWDTAAGQAIVEAAGGKVLEINTQKSLKYNKKNQLNPWFIAHNK